MQIGEPLGNVSGDLKEGFCPGPGFRYFLLFERVLERSAVGESARGGGGERDEVRKKGFFFWFASLNSLQHYRHHLLAP